MNILKNMEAIFIVALAVSLSASAFAAPRAAHAPTQQVVHADKMIKVVISGKRMSHLQGGQHA
ncbi:MAG: hypothetical protein ACLGI6_19080 [Gammaproteobacteria bacterium]